MPKSVWNVMSALQTNKDDSEGIRTPAGRAQWISSPPPVPLGHAVTDRSNAMQIERGKTRGEMREQKSLTWRDVRRLQLGSLAPRQRQRQQ